MEDRLDMAIRRRLTNRFKDEYAKASKKEKKLILDRLVEVGMGRSTARRLSGESARPAGKGRLERRRKPGSSVLLRCLLTGSVFPQCGLMVFPGNVIVSR